MRVSLSFLQCIQQSNPRLFNLIIAAAGEFVTELGCSLCHIGRYAPSAANLPKNSTTGCYATPPGFRSTGFSETNKSYPAGYGFGATALVQCAPGTFSKGNGTECFSCGAGFFSKAQASSCTSCLPGSFSDAMLVCLIFVKRFSK